MTDTYSEAYRAKCEAETLARKSPAEITSFLELVEKRRGKAAADKLRSDTREGWKKRNLTKGG